MNKKCKNKSSTPIQESAVPFDTAEEAWFWFVASQEAKVEGARFAAGLSLYPRPCEPIDILRVLDRLYRKRRLLRDHLLVLRYYGRRKLAPDPYRSKEARSYKIWQEAIERIEPVLIRKGIVKGSADKSLFLFTNNILAEAGAFS